MTKELDRLKELIPDYLSGRLSEKEASELEKAAQESTELRLELEEGKQIRNALDALEKEADFPAEEIFQNISRIIEAEEQDETKSARGLEEHGPGLWQRVKSLFASPGFAWGVCAAQAVVVVFAFFVFHGTQPSFETMSVTSHGHQGIQYNIIFKEDRKFKDIVSFLEKNKIRIVDGPTGKGLFVVEVSDREKVKKIRESGLVEFLAPAY